jgi:predicted MarR family transcription regulator
LITAAEVDRITGNKRGRSAGEPANGSFAQARATDLEEAVRKKKVNETTKELSLLLLYLVGWEEPKRNNPAEMEFRSWRGFLYEMLNELEAKKLIRQSRSVHSKTVLVTDTGKQLAEQLKQKYLR